METPSKEEELAWKNLGAPESFLAQEDELSTL